MLLLLWPLPQARSFTIRLPFVAIFHLPLLRSPIDPTGAHLRESRSRYAPGVQLTDQQSDFEIVSSLDLDEIRKTTRESLVVHGVRCSVISRADAERGALQMGADEDL